MAGIGKDYGSDIVPADISSVTNLNKTQLEFRDVTTTPWPGSFPASLQFPSTEPLNQAYVGYDEIFVLAQAALVGICQRNRACQRYFQESEAENVRKYSRRPLVMDTGQLKWQTPLGHSAWAIWIVSVLALTRTLALTYQVLLLL